MVHQVLTSGSYNKSLHSDVDSLKSSVKQGDSSFDIMSNSDKSNSNAPDASGLHMKLMISSTSATAAQADRDYLKCRKMEKIM